ncbi:M48 family metalloprotease [Nocardia yamanashiensis]|uniref:M48 family metalloprotease n=1 Tax=Nocardia yamanashiensis TaxID=209247 RepID=UPI0012FD19BA|nr:M48 family metalloprotease [Nocardia yamanashiensis]
MTLALRLSPALGTAMHEWTGPQSAQLISAWREVAAAAEVPEHRCLVRVDDTTTHVAAAIGSRMIVLKDTEIEESTRPQLAAVLAHELGHLLDPLRSNWQALPHLYRAPLYVANLPLRAAFLLLDRWLGKSTMFLGIAAVTVLVLFPATTVLTLFLLVGPLGAPIAACLLIIEALAESALQRQNELVIDRFAVDLGFGLGMLSFLQRHERTKWENRNPLAPPGLLRERLAALAATHPSAAKRITAVEQRIRVLAALD